ncbi:ATP-binding protein [Streptomyces sp. NPDC003300]|uniref:ATP-binding protein n=1 Tax=unclassified Streptomyces TaxID=2593676 RepID=UPI0033A889A6
MGRARHELRLAVNAWGMTGLADTAVLVLSELFTNAVRHARGPEDRLVETRYERLTDGALRIEVHDANSVRPEAREPSVDAESGRGLALVDVLTAGRWGVSERLGVGKLVWAVCADDTADEVPR